MVKKIAYPESDIRETQIPFTIWQLYRLEPKYAGDEYVWCETSSGDADKGVSAGTVIHPVIWAEDGARPIADRRSAIVRLDNLMSINEALASIGYIVDPGPDPYGILDDEAAS